MDYPKIWFLGPEAQKIQAVEGKPNNNGINHIFNYIHSSIINYGTIISQADTLKIIFQNQAMMTVMEII